MITKILFVVVCCFATNSIVARVVSPVISYDETWLGSWIWLPDENRTVPECHIDPALWIVKYPGSWDLPMVNFIIGGAGSGTIEDIYWDIYTRDAMVLFPSKSLSNIVYKNANSGYDFEKFDAAKAATEVAKLDDINLSLSIWWDRQELAGKALLDALRRYPYTDIVIITSGAQQRTDVVAFLDNRVSNLLRSRVVISSAESIEGRYDLTVMGKFPVEYRTFLNWHAQNTHKGNVLFMRKIDWYEIHKDFEHEYRRYLVALSAYDKWTVYVNGKKLHSSQRVGATWQNMDVSTRTYEFTELINPDGENWVAVAVEPGSSQKGLLVNIKAGEMVYGSDTNWYAMAIDEIPDGQTVSEYVGDDSLWQKAIKVGRHSIIMQTGKRFWDRLTPWQEEAE